MLYRRPLPVSTACQHFRRPLTKSLGLHGQRLLIGAVNDAGALNLGQHLAHILIGYACVLDRLSVDKSGAEVDVEREAVDAVSDQGLAGQLLDQIHRGSPSSLDGYGLLFSDDYLLD